MQTGNHQRIWRSRLAALDQTYPLWPIAVFAICGWIGLLNHEMWRDEIRIWMVVRDSSNWSDLLANLRYETGHFFLWYLLLYPLSQVIRDPLVMQVVHWAIATATVYVLLQHSPFPRWQKLLLVFSYFMFYEYAIVVRNYGLSVLLLFLICTLFEQRKSRYWGLAILLFLLANIHYYTLMLAIALGLTLMLEPLLDPVSRDRLQGRHWDVAISLSIWLLGNAIAALQMIPPPGVNVSSPIRFDLSLLASTLAAVWKSYAPMPGLAYHFWNTNILDDLTAAILSLLLLAYAITVLARKPIPLWFYLLSSGQILVFFYIKHGGGIRHWGYLFITFLVSLWLSDYFPDQKQTASKVNPNLQLIRAIAHFFQRQKTQFLAILLTIQCLAGWFAYGMDLILPFSEAKATASLIQTQPLNQSPIVGIVDLATMTVSGFLDQRFYYPESNKWGTFLLGVNIDHRELSREQLWARTQTILQQYQRVVLVLNRPLETQPFLPASVRVEKIGERSRAIVQDERFYVYLLQVSRLTPS